MTVKFGTSGLRGLAEELVGAVAQKHVRAFVRHLQAKGCAKLGEPLCVAWDFRASSPAILQDVVAAIVAEGQMPKLLGAVPTPALAYYAAGIGAGAIMITGSHIPGNRNGIKFYRPDGEINKRDEEAISAGALAVETCGPVKTPAVDERSARDAFLQRFAAVFPGDALKGLRVGVYQHSTVARDMLVTALSSAGAEVTGLGRSDYFIPVDTEAVSPETETLIGDWCATGRFDAIVSADGDGDRPLVADARGQILRGDFVGMLTARYIVTKTVATPVTSNSGIDRYIDGGVLRTRVGSPYVIAAMEEALRRGADRISGFEANGGFFTASPFVINGAVLEALPTRDCFLPILAVLATAAQSGQPVSTLVERFTLPVALSGRLENFAVERSAGLMALLMQDAQELNRFMQGIGEIAAVDHTDGLRCSFKDGSVVHLRPSGNAPEFRCYVEAHDRITAQELLHQALDKIALAS